MTQYNHTPIETGAAADALTFNTPFGQLDAKMGDLTTLSTTAKGSLVAAINEMATLQGGQVGATGTNNASWSINADGSDESVSLYFCNDTDGDGQIMWTGDAFLILQPVEITGGLLVHGTDLLTASIFSAEAAAKYHDDSYYTVAELIRLVRDGTPSADFGGLLDLRGHTTSLGTISRMAALGWSWIDPAPETARGRGTLLGACVGAQEVECMTWFASGGGDPTIGFFGSLGSTQYAHIADPTSGSTVDSQARAAINSILSALEGYGLLNWH